MTKLSICIPTYNRAAYLAELPDSICIQDGPDLEVVVADDASTDNTNAVVERYHGKIGKLRYVRHDQNLGLDGNFMAVVEHATGEFVWLMGDDDKLEPCAVKLVIQKLEEWNGIAGMTLGVIDYSSDFTRVTGLGRMPSTQILSGAENVFCVLYTLLGFMSGLVVDRRQWLVVAAMPETQNFRNYYLQVYIVGRILQVSDKWGVIEERCVGFRTGNDQFLKKLGWFDRVQIDVLAYEQIATSLFGNDSEVFRYLQKRVLREHIYRRLLNSKKARGSDLSFSRTFSLLYSHYRNIPAFWYEIFPVLLTPGVAIRVSREIYRMIKRRTASVRSRLPHPWNKSRAPIS